MTSTEQHECVQHHGSLDGPYCGPECDRLTRAYYGDDPYDEADTMPPHDCEGRPCKGSTESGYAQRLDAGLHCNYCGHLFD